MVQFTGSQTSLGFFGLSALRKNDLFVVFINKLTIYLNTVLFERKVLKPRLTQSNDIKLVLLKDHDKLVKCRHYSLDVKMGNGRVFRVFI